MTERVKRQNREEKESQVRVFELRNAMGMHVRTAGTFTQALTPLDCDVWVSRDDRPAEEVNGKSILGLLTLTAYCGTRLRIRVAGPDGDRALAVLEDLFANNFGEDEDDEGESGLVDQAEA
jgi:phosphocarrier protein